VPPELVVASESPVAMSARDATRAEQVSDQLAAIMAVSRAVSEGRALTETLGTIAHTAATLASASASAIVLRRRESPTTLAVAGSFGLSEQYADELNRIQPIEVGSGPSGLAAQERRPVAVDDVLADPLFSPWRRLAVREHYRALVSVPLQLGNGRRVIGVLNTYRDAAGPWSDEEIGLLETLADHAAIAIQTAHLLDESRRQVRGLSLVVRSLRTQSHEHSNLVHALYGLLTLDETEEALELISNTDTRYQTTQAVVASGIDNVVIAGFLAAEVVIAGNSGIELEIDERSGLQSLPASLSELDAVTLFGNLIQNATEAVAEVEPQRRRVSILLMEADGVLEIRVRDQGPGVPAADVERVLRSGYSTKGDHVGIGLSLVRGIVSRAGGSLEIEAQDGPGATFTIRIPY
jgi:signal transduction histidine kinase